MNRKSLIIGILIGMSIVGCIAAVSGDEEWSPVVEGRKYAFHGIGVWLTHGYGTITSILPNGWVQTEDGVFVNMKLVDTVDDITPATP